MVVMVIMGMLATAVALAMGGFTDSARKTKAVTDIATYVNAIDAFYAVQGRYPTNDEGLAILAAKSKLSPSGYIKKIKKDPWNHPYVYRTPGKTGPFEIISYGADRKEGGSEVNADISSENLEND
jgi:general secretion pathway protein G